MPPSSSRDSLSIGLNLQFCDGSHSIFAHGAGELAAIINTRLRPSASLEAMDDMLTEAAIGLGATPLVAFRTITMPLFRTGFLAAAIFTFVTSLDELVVTLFLTGPRLSTLPVEMYNYIEFTSDPTIAAISVLLIVLTSAIVLLTERFIGFGDLVG